MAMVNNLLTVQMIVWQGMFKGWSTRCTCLPCISRVTILHYELVGHACGYTDCSCCAASPCSKNLGLSQSRCKYQWMVCRQLSKSMRYRHGRSFSVFYILSAVLFDLQSFARIRALFLLGREWPLMLYTQDYRWRLSCLSSCFQLVYHHLDFELNHWIQCSRQTAINFFIMSCDGFEHHFGQRFFDIKPDAGSCFAHENLFARRSCDSGTGERRWLFFWSWRLWHRREMCLLARVFCLPVMSLFSERKALLWAV